MRGLTAGLVLLLLLASRLPAQTRLAIGQGAGREFGDIVSLPLTIETTEEVAGFVMVFQWDGRKGRGEEILLATGVGEALEGADILSTRVEADYMVVSAVLDIDGDGPAVLPVGASRIGTARVRCTCEGDRQEIAIALPHASRHSLVRGGQVVDNVVVTGGSVVGLDQGLQLGNGLLVCNGIIDGEPTVEPEITCGGLTEDGSLTDAVVEPGGRTTVGFFYKSPVSDDPRELIQGFQVAARYDCRLSCVEDSVAMAEALLAVDAEFFMSQCDNDPADGDGCELVVGALVDSAIPVDGRTLPGTDTYEALFTADFVADADCGEILDIEFVDGLNGEGIVPVANVVSINNFSLPWVASSCSVLVDSESTNNGSFRRGDCNFNDAINVADAATILGHLFLNDERAFDPPCFDACDTDDTGNLNVTDAIFLLNWVFVVGNPEPPPPGPRTAGPDPTEDELDCFATDGGCR